ncbi:MAG: hypothetical protein JWO52_6273 [Gammaproteobacteria bacterium]|nr:hypothetical protein [Gammaproteobacteria bacterium]
MAGWDMKMGTAQTLHIAHSTAFARICSHLLSRAIALLADSLSHVSLAELSLSA